MIFHCPKCAKKLNYQPGLRLYHCPACKTKFTRLEVAFVKGGVA